MDERLFCSRCGKYLDAGGDKWLELDAWTGLFHDPTTDPVKPEDHSQGGFCFGKDCAAIILKNGGKLDRPMRVNPRGKGVM